eukprot:Filipodium_phascolosomae@DN2717_c1_g1_i18.p1
MLSIKLYISLTLFHEVVLQDAELFKEVKEEVAKAVEILDGSGGHSGGTRHSGGSGRCGVGGKFGIVAQPGRMVRIFGSVYTPPVLSDGTPCESNCYYKSVLHDASIPFDVDAAKSHLHEASI